MVQQAAASTAVGSNDRVIFWMSDVQRPPVQGGVLCTVSSVRDSGPRRDTVALSEKVALGERQWPSVRDSGPL